MKTIPLTWLIFTILFACFSVYHFSQAMHSYPNFQWKTFDNDGVDFFSPSAVETRLNVESFVKQWNEYIDQQNKASFRINIIAAIGYLFTAIMSLISMILPGPYNIKDTANYLYDNCTKSNIYKRCFGQVKPIVEESEDDKNQE